MILAFLSTQVDIFSSYLLKKRLETILEVKSAVLQNGQINKKRRPYRTPPAILSTLIL